MSNISMRTRKAAPIGVSPTTSQKLVYVSNKLGLKGIKDQQGSTVNIFDTVILTTQATARQTLSFFTNTQNKSRNFSNFQNGTLNAGETLVIEELTFFLVTLSATTLSADSTTMSTMTPLSQVPATVVSLKSALMMGLININIANVRVGKDILNFEQNPNFNNATNGIALGKILTSADAAQYPEEIIGQGKIKLEAPPVLPPNQKLEITLELPPVGTVTGNIGIVCVAGRFGSIYAAKTTL